MRVLMSERAGALHYRVDGPEDGPAILFCNSLGADLRLWDAMLDHMPAGYRFVRFDKRGHGLSEPPQAPFGIEDLASDALEIADHVGLGAFAFVGVSIGGLVGQAIAAPAGERLRALALLDTGARIGTAELWNERIAKVRDGGVGSMAAAIVERWFTADYHADPAHVLPWRALVSATSAEGYARCCEAIRDADFETAARAIAAPTLCLWGDADISTPPDVNRALAEMTRAARAVEIQGAGHLPCVERPEATATEIAKFLKDSGY